MMTYVSRLGGIEREDGEVPEQVPVGARVGVDEARVGGVPSVGRPDEDARAATMPSAIATPKTTSRQAASGQNGTPSFVRCSWYGSRYVFGSTGSPGFGGSEMPCRRTSSRCRPTNGEDHRRDEEDVDGEEAAQRRAADGVAAEDEARDPRRR